MSTRGGTNAGTSVVAVGVLQVIVFAVTTAAWVGNTLFAGNACAPGCDWGAGEFAVGVYFGIALVTFLCSAVAYVYARRTGRDLAWVPLVGCGLIILGFFGALALFQRAMS